MADSNIKPEIKLDPAASITPTHLADVSDFEDDTDLHIPPADAGQAWLVKLPKYIWEAWNEMYRHFSDDTPIEIGKMRVYDNPDGADPLQQKIQIRLNPGVPQHVELPKTYNVDLKTIGYSNTVVFSEKDLPGHRTQPFGRRSHRPTGIPSKGSRYGPQTKPGTYRSAIPKQTTLAPVIHHVADAAPVQDESYFTHFDKTYQASLRPKKTTTFQTGIDRGMHPGSNLTTFNSFNISSRPGGNSGRGKKAVKEKAVRISQEALLDAVYHCFRRYRYWSLKALKNELKQPETFIKETLESIATLVRSGDFAMNYVLKPEYASMANIKPEEVREETALVASGDEGEGEVLGEESGMGSEAEMEGDDDEDEGDFEDVRMGGS